MKNVRTIFTKKNLNDLMIFHGFKNIEIINDSFTDSNEQRSTKWMSGKSFKDFTFSDIAKNINLLLSQSPSRVRELVKFRLNIM